MLKNLKSKIKNLITNCQLQITRKRILLAMFFLFSFFLIFSFYLYFSFSPFNLKFQVEELREADPMFADPADLEALEKIKYYPVSLNRIPEDCINGVIAVEDKSFWTNHGVDIKGMGRLGLSFITFGHFGGGSTITQQVVKLSRNSFYSRTPLDKYVEIVYAFKLNNSEPKEKILELYFNEGYFGDFNYGIAAAASSYFKKEISELNLAECSYLAGMPKAPNYYSPTIGDINAGRERQKRVLEEMMEEGYITGEEMNEALGEDIFKK